MQNLFGGPTREQQIELDKQQAVYNLKAEFAYFKGSKSEKQALVNSLIELMDEANFDKKLIVHSEFLNFWKKQWKLK